VLKKLIAISFCFVYLFSTTELHELIKLPLLIEHFAEHRQNQHITLWQFLYIHYAMGDVKDADYDKDMKLPFKSHDNCVAGNTTIYIPLSEKLSIQKPIQFVEKKVFETEDRLLPTSFFSTIWQPPRHC
jgi:hypothetical protein